MVTTSQAAPIVTDASETADCLEETGFRMELFTDEEGREKYRLIPLTEEEFLHPQEGYHLPNSTFHDNTAGEIKEILRRRYASREDVGVFGDLIINWGIQGLGNHCPDVCVVFGLKDKGKNRESFVVAEEGTKPVVVIEVVSPRYRRTDRETKVKDYARAGVEEYIILDRRPQRGELIDEVIGYRLEEGSYVPITPDEEGGIGCQTIGVKVGLIEGKVKLWEAETGAPLLSSQEIEEQARQEAQRAEQEKQRANSAELEIAKLKQLLQQAGIEMPESD
jgi:Uma2 family endonuclease